MESTCLSQPGWQVPLPIGAALDVDSGHICACPWPLPLCPSAGLCEHYTRSLTMALGPETLYRDLGACTGLGTVFSTQ